MRSHAPAASSPAQLAPNTTSALVVHGFSRAANQACTGTRLAATVTGPHLLVAHQEPLLPQLQHPLQLRLRLQHQHLHLLHQVELSSPKLNSWPLPKPSKETQTSATTTGSLPHFQRRPSQPDLKPPSSWLTQSGKLLDSSTCARCTAKLTWTLARTRTQQILVAVKTKFTTDVVVCS